MHLGAHHCGRRVHSGAPWGHRIHSDTFCSFRCALGVVGLLWARSGGRRFHSGSLSSFRRALGVIVFIWAC